jgi:hypothetical protein
MTDWLSKLQEAVAGRGSEISAPGFLTLIAASALAAFVVARLYSHFYGRQASGSDIHRSFPLLAIAITAIFVCIQFSLPLSLGLLGALSIVRFRTPIKEPEEIGFLMVVIATSLAAATGRLLFLGLVLVAATVGLLAQELLAPLFRRQRDSGLVIATYAEADYAERSGALFAALAAASRRGGLESLTTQDGRVTVTWRFAGLPPATAPELERRLHSSTRPESLAIVYAVGQP